MMSITCTDQLNQTSLADFKLTIYACAQTNWINCDGSYQRQWTKWSSGYQLESDSKACVAITSLEFGQLNRLKFIAGCVWCSIGFIVFLYFTIKRNRSNIFIINFQVVLIVYLISNSKDFEIKSYLASFYILKGDLSFIEYYVPMSKSIWSTFEMIADENQFEFTWKSTVINFIWTEIFILIAFGIYIIYQKFRYNYSFSNSFISITTSFIFDSVIIFILPFELLSTNLEINYLLKSFSQSQLVLLWWQIIIIIVLLYINLKYRNEFCSSKIFSVLFILKVLIWSNTYTPTLIAICYLCFIYVLYLQYAQSRLNYSKIKLLMLEEFTNQIMVAIIYIFYLMKEKGFYPDSSEQQILIATILISYMMLIYMIFSAAVSCFSV